MYPPKVNWEEKIKELEDFFSAIQLPEQVKFNDFTVISNPSRFVESHLQVVKNNIGKDYYLPYLRRLHKLKMILENEKSKTDTKGSQTVA